MLSSSYFIHRITLVNKHIVFIVSTSKKFNFISLAFLKFERALMQSNIQPNAVSVNETQQL